MFDNIGLGFLVILREHRFRIDSALLPAIVYYVSVVLNMTYFIRAPFAYTCLAINYRKALTPSTAFPAQLLDVTAGYAYLLSLGFEPANITLIGDSAGGHLILALSRYLADLDAAVPQLGVGMPGALMLISVRLFLQFTVRLFT